MTAAAELTGAGLATARALAAAAGPAEVGATWVAPVVVAVDTDAPVVGAGDIGAALYDGTAGVVLALAAAAGVADEPLLRDTGVAAARHALAGAEPMLDAGRLGLFDGATGVALAAVLAGRSLRAEALVAGGATVASAAARRFAARVVERPQPVEHDVIGGTAGTLLALLQLAELLSDQRVRALVAPAAEWLADAAVPQVWGAAWPGRVPAHPPLLGLAHGAAGIALALLEAGARTRSERLTRAGRAGFAYERSWFDPDRPGWPDLRRDGADGWMTAWCHGALGIGLTRLRAAALTGDQLALVEASAALQAARDLVVRSGTALRQGQPGDCSCCHGLSGAVELQLAAATTTGVADHRRAAQRTAGLLLEQRAAAGAWPCGLPGAGEVPGLMTGTAGIALTLLRAAAATTTPHPANPIPLR